jgi:hypothetical protein
MTACPAAERSWERKNLTMSKKGKRWTMPGKRRKMKRRKRERERMATKQAWACTGRIRR